MNTQSSSKRVRISMLLLTVAMLFIMSVMCTRQVQAATAPSITAKAVSNLTRYNAQLNFTVSNPSKVKITQAGFILYDKTGKKLATRYDKISTTSASFPCWYDINKYYGKLTVNTTYQYKLYIETSAEKYYFSAMYSFTTLKNPSITVNAVSNITSTDARLNNTVNNAAKVNIVKAGFILYDSNGNKLVDKYDTMNTKSTSFPNWYDMSKYYGTLKANTTYKYKFYIVTNIGTVYSSSVNTFKTAAASTFTARTKQPAKTNKYYVRTANGGYNKCILGNGATNGYVLPNCVGYAWGRAYEILKKAPALSTSNACNWWSYNKTLRKSGKGYKYGSTPKVGAIVCWDKTTSNKYGHVAVVEKISGNTVTISYSTWSNGAFYLKKYTAGTGCLKVGSTTSFGKFQGYIYLLG